MKNKNILLAIALIVLTAAFRIANAELHFWNLAPVAALGLFSGAVLKDKRLAFLLPLLATLASDIYFQFFTNTPGFYGVNQAFVYGAMLLITLMGTKMGEPKALKIAGFSIAGSLIFFILSNFGMWAQQIATPPAQRIYSADLSGLGQTFLMALPFYSGFGTSAFFNALIGDLLFCGILFGAYAVLKARATAPTVNHARL